MRCVLAMRVSCRAHLGAARWSKAATSDLGVPSHMPTRPFCKFVILYSRALLYPPITTAAIGPAMGDAYMQELRTWVSKSVDPSPDH